jgi:hypothetical protein
MHGRDVYKLSIGNSEGKRPLKGPWRRRENIKMDLTGAGYEGMDYIILTQEKWLTVAKTVRKTSRFHKSGKFLDHLSNHQFPTHDFIPWHDVKTTTSLIVLY